LDFSNAQKLTESTSINEKNNGFYYWEFANKKEEVFLGSKPSKHYAAGILYPLSNVLEEVEDDAGLASSRLSDESKQRNDEENNNESGLPQENSYTQNYLPSNMGITFAVSEHTENVKVYFNCGVYEEKDVNKEIQIAHKTKFWFRKSLYAELEINLDGEQQARKVDVNLKTMDDKIYDKISLRIDSLCRVKKLEDRNEKVKIVTITATNVTKNVDPKDDHHLLFQCEISAENNELFLPYPNASQLDANIPEEDKKFDMLYRNEHNYAFGQNCSTTWDINSTEIDKVSSTFIPTYEIKTMTPDIEILN